MEPSTTPETTPETILGEDTLVQVLCMSTPDLIKELEALEDNFDMWTCNNHNDLIVWSMYWEVAESILIDRGYYDKKREL